MLDSIFQPFVDGSPTTVMASAALSRMLGAARLDALFEESRQGQYVNTLMFSTLVDLMAAVVIGSRGSIHAAYQAAGEKMKVSAPSVYEKMRNVETCTSQALVRESAAEMASLVDQMNGALPSLAPGYAVRILRILDGNCIAASEHRIQELRPLAAGALPGKSLAVLDPRRRLILDVFPCEDGHANERSLLAQVLSTVVKGELWIDDRNFCTFGFLSGINDREAFFITRQHGNMTGQPLDELRKVGEVDGKVVYEQKVLVRGEDGGELRLRRIEMHLKNATRDGDTIISMLTNLPESGPGAVGAMRVAELYASRWQIETAFQELAQHFESEINTLGYPKAALFGFCVALVVFNAVSLMKAALRGCHGAEKIEKEVSNYYIAAELKSVEGGMMIAVPLEHWQVFIHMTSAEFAATLLMLAGKVDLRKFKKHPRGPKKPQPPRTYDPKHPHVSTAKLLEQRKAMKRTAILP